LQRIDADLLVPGRGEPIADASVILDGPVIAYAGPRADAPDTPGAETHTAATVMPGMWECHGHFTGTRGADIVGGVLAPMATVGARIARDAEAALLAGFTSVREMGGHGLDLVAPIAEGTVVGPTIYGAGAILSMTGGHGDLHGHPLSFVHDYSARGGWLRLCDGVPECLKAVREQLRRNARVIKVCASGGVMSEVDHPIHAQFSHEELRAIVEEAGRAERVVAAHCHGKPGIMAALEAGIRTIEHGTFLDDEACDAMLEADATLVTTRLVVNRLLEHAETTSMPAYAHAKLAAMAEQHTAAMALAVSKGIRIALGTDIWMSGADLPLSWGQNAHELPLLVEVGMTPLQAIEAATANGPVTLGPQAPRSGELREGYDADVLAVARSPLDDITVLTDPANLTGVWKAGRLVRTTSG
jgi:imidazolonepropionase-like amidohydrolase